MRRHRDLQSVGPYGQLLNNKQLLQKTLISRLHSVAFRSPIAVLYSTGAPPIFICTRSSERFYTDLTAKLQMTETGEPLLLAGYTASHRAPGKPAKTSDMLARLLSPLQNKHGLFKKPKSSAGNGICAAHGSLPSLDAPCASRVRTKKHAMVERAAGNMRRAETSTVSPVVSHMWRRSLL